MGNIIRNRNLCAAVALGVTMMLVGGAAGEATVVPAVTGAATSPSHTSAALSGTIQPGGIATFWEFQWGTSTAYGNNTTPGGPLSDTGSDAVLAPITALQPGTRYHFRLVAVQGAAGASGQPTLSAGADMTFITPAAGATSSQASLLGRTLAVHRGSTLMAWRCSGTSGAVCKGKISLRARGKISGKVKTVNCGAGTFTASTGRQHAVRANLGRSCLALVKDARRHRLRASLRASFSQGTGNVTTPVTLVFYR